LYIKTIYKDEPVFRNAKVVYSVFENQFEENLGKDFARKAGLNEIDNKQVATLAKSDSNSLYITGITHADAIVKASSDIDAEVIKFIKKQKGKLMHEHVEGSYGDDYNNLYDELLQSQI
jgi:starch synthase